MRYVASLVPAIPISAVLLGFLLVPAAPARAASARLDGMERGVVRAINRQRERAGLRRVRASLPLARAADLHSREMLAGNYFAHSSRNGASFAARIHRFTRVRAVGETLAWTTNCGRRSAGTVVSMWMHSPPHRAILLSGMFNRVGLARRAGRLGSHPACVVTGDFAR